ncbi:MAG: ThuA domain-containing protein, partial [Planctomycetaceae bacterium]|nr:ThuA domain-containing protein [Planctomycetaceae bacterium]
TLNQFDGLVLYANIDRIEDEQAKALLNYVASGKGFIPLHCATYCWRNNSEIVALMGGQFLRHGGQVFTTVVTEPTHPVMKGYGSFTSWDETYIHHLHNEKNRTVLEYRVEGDQADGQTREPWTWVRTHGQGRVFYTAWGHDSRTWNNAGFHNLVERGIRWAVGDDPAKAGSFTDMDTFSAPQMTELPTDVKPFEFVDVGPKIPNYTPGERWGVQGKPHNTMQLPLPSAESIRHFVTPQGMAVRLYADETHFNAKPIAMNWDERGRLWVCETVDYPNELGGNRDRIRVCEDTDGDLVADRFTVFAEGLSIPTAVLPFRGGVVVQNGTETIYLKDTDGDGQADLKKQLITGWALGDTHGGVSNFRYGLDNWIWSMQGYNASSPRFDGREVQSFRQGFWRFRLSQDDPPTVTDLEFVRSSNNNTWGLGISEDGLIFGSTANRNPSMFMPIANRYYERVRGWAPSTLGTIADTFSFKPITENVRQVDQFGGYTAGAGHALYTARTFPKQWWNRTAFVCGPTGHLVGTFVLRRRGADYQSTSPVNLLASNDEWSAPIMAEVGPDGAVWVIDWYNYIVQHNPTPQGFETGKGNAYESDLRDKKHGRIYRVVPTDAAGDSSRDTVHAWSSLANASVPELVNNLRHPSMQWRLHAQRLLVEQNAVDAVPALLALLEDRSVDEVGLNPGAIHALHTLNGLGCIENDAAVLEAVSTALNHPSPSVRRNAVDVLPANAAGLKVLLAHEEGGSNTRLVDDQDQQVQLHAILRLADMPADAAAGTIAAGLALVRKDPIILDAITSAASVHSVHFLQGLGDSSDISDPSAETLRVCSIVAEHMGRGRPDANEVTQILKGLESVHPQIAEVVVRGITAGWPKDHSVTAGKDAEASLIRLIGTIPPAGKGNLLHLAALCRSTALDSYAQEIIDALLAVTGDSDASMNDRSTAAREAVSFQPNSIDVVDEILGHLTAQSQPELARGLIEAVGLSVHDDAGSRMIRKTASLTPGMRSTVIRVLLARPATTVNLLDAIGSHDLELSDLTLDQKQALRTHPDQKIRSAAEKVMAASGGLPDADRDKVLQSLLPLCEEEGDVTSGKAMFVKHCSRCHMHGTEGKTIGPNLTGMAVHPKHELLTHIIDPSRSVEGNFRIFTVLTTDGIVVNGMMASETRTSITLIDTEAKEHVVPRDDIDELVGSRKSLMPEGFEKQMNSTELRDLLQFLTDKGRFIPVSLDRYATAISTKSLFENNPRDNGADRMVFADWNAKVVRDVPFILTDPRGKTVPNIILLNGPLGSLPPQMPRSVTLPCNSPAKAIHLLSGVGGWSFPFSRTESTSMIVRLHYAGGETEDHPLINGVHIADYIRRVDVPGSEFAFALNGQQIRFLSITPKASDKLIETIELVKGPDSSAPIVMAVTIERP